MASTSGVGGLLTRLRGTLDPDTRPDAELLGEYLTTRSDAAFAELTRRYAPLVWGVCRRTVGHRQAAEDAFQATFLVLVRKAAAVRPPALAGWLHAVAVHTSLRARAMSTRHTSLDHDLDVPDRPPPEPTDHDVLRVLDEEIARLPEKLRTAVALCELDGLSRRDASKRLGIAEGTLSSRLAAARKQLAARLRGRGVTLGAGGIAAVLDSGTAVAVPPVVAPATETVFTLAAGAIRAMFLTKLKWTAAGALAVLALAALGGTLVPPAAATDRPTVRRNAPLPRVEREGVILVGVQEDNVSRIDLITPKGEKVASVPLGDTSMNHPTLSRDGRRVAVWSQDLVKPMQPIRAGTDTRPGTLWVYDIDTPDEPVAKFEHNLSGRILFAPDGQSVFALEHLAHAQPNKPTEFAIYRFDLRAKKKEKLDLPADHQLADISPDGKALLTTVFTRPDGKLHATPHRVPLNTLKPEPLTKTSIRAVQFSPDGKRFLGIKYLDPNDGWKQGLTVVDVKTGRDTEVKLEDDTFRLWHAAWSPDGKKLVVHRVVKLGEEKAKGPQPIPVGGGKVPDTILIQQSEVAVRNLDGSEPKPLLTTTRETHIFGIDWR